MNTLEFSGMKRREALSLLAGGIIGSSSTMLVHNGGNVDKTVNDFGNMTDLELGGDSDNLTQEFRVGSPGFEKIEFLQVSSNESLRWFARITFGSHDMDGFGLRHTSLESIEDDLYVCEAPTSTGTRDVPIAAILREQDAVYPDRQFDLVGYDGQFSECSQEFQLNVSTDVDGSVTFTVPEEVAPESAFRKK